MMECVYYFNGINLDVEFNYTAGCEGVIYAPAEDCYPPEDAEVEILSVYCNHEPVETDDIYVGVGDKQQWLITAIEDWIIENASDLIEVDDEH